jgi:hypothetical protein
METNIQEPEPQTATPPKPGEEQQSTPLTPSEKTPQEFYVEMTKRKDVRVILQELAGV